MKKFVMAAGVMMFAVVASADTSNGTLAVTGTVASSINLTIETASASSGGTGTAAATSGLGSVSKFGAAPTGFSLTRGASDWTLSGSIGVKVDKANLTSSNYSLTARLQSAPATGIVWKVQGQTLNESTGTSVVSAGTYGQNTPLTWDIVTADSAAAGAFDNTINFVATSN